MLKRSLYQGLRRVKISPKPQLFLTPLVQPTFNNKTQNHNKNQTRSIQIIPKNFIKKTKKTFTTHLKNFQGDGRATKRRKMHPLSVAAPEGDFENYLLYHSIWSKEECDAVEITHEKPNSLPAKLAYYSVQTLRTTWDVTTGYAFKRFFGFSKKQWILRLVFLETVAGVPGMVFGGLRHFRSLRTMQRDYGWINTLLAEAENERMHLLVALKLYEPGIIFRAAVIVAQGVYANFFILAHLFSPRYCHRFVGYLEEEAVKTYTSLIDQIEDENDAGLTEWRTEIAHKIARKYWELPTDATWLDVFYQIRADEAHHRDVNHTLAPLSTKNDESGRNPFRRESIEENRKTD